jgi:hypothetical protein
LDARRFRVFAIPNGGLRDKAVAAKLKKTGVLAGVPDIAIAGAGGHVWFLEVKTSAGKLSADQESFIQWMIVASVPYAVVHSIHEVRVALEFWRIPTREAVS